MQDPQSSRMYQAVMNCTVSESRYHEQLFQDMTSLCVKSTQSNNDNYMENGEKNLRILTLLFENIILKKIMRFIYANIFKLCNEDIRKQGGIP